MTFLRILAPCCALIALSGISKAVDPKLDLNDVSWLWPVPAHSSDLDNVIRMSEFTSPSGEDVWSDQQFEDLLKVVDDGLTEVDGFEVDFEPEIRKKSAWHIAGMRFDPSAPGCSPALRDAFGSSPQIRLIVQPVTLQGSSTRVHDVAVHLVYEWVTGQDERKRKLPDSEKVSDIIADLDHLKSLSHAGGASTAGKPLGVHPGLKAGVPGLNQQVEQFLRKHLSHSKLSAMALMGIVDGIEPWIFFGTSRLPNGRFGKIPFPIPSAEPQMINFRREGGQVAPAPIVNNRSPISAARVVPENQRRGVSTAALFGRSFELPDMNGMAVIGKDGAGNVVFDTLVRNKDIPDVIADPLASHFFNTDCSSCHSETTRRQNLRLSQGNFAFKIDGVPPKIKTENVPTNSWNVRNFGWFPPHFFVGGGATRATVTQRTANETAEVVEFIERNFRGGL